jgi:hypothetical protein
MMHLTRRQDKRDTVKELCFGTDAPFLRTSSNTDLFATMDHSLGPTFEWTKQDSSLDSHHSTLVSSHYHEELAKQWPFGIDQNPLQQTQSHSYTSIVTPADLETTVGNEKDEYREGICFLT